MGLIFEKSNRAKQTSIKDRADNQVENSMSYFTLMMVRQIALDRSYHRNRTGFRPCGDDEAEGRDERSAAWIQRVT